ncbi:MAG: protein-methionine-sulfoxide reductase catalytic subunit MsrP, partial [Acidobacteria bacterium]|nr:protein-methionine-sulfoxide reductase catalytic subunit MsrP [Acidobacteriota bacterium]
MIIRQAPDFRSSDITDERLYLRRRDFIQAAVVPAVAALAGLAPAARLVAAGQDQIPNYHKGVVTADEPLTPFEDVTTYNNFYEFGTDKADPARNVRGFRLRPWTVKVDGLVNKPGDYNLDDILKPQALEERIYRLRCVEAWSMVIPWIGFPLGDLLKRVEPQGGATFVEFTTLLDPKMMPGQRVPVLNWPYVEGLRLDEAMHPLAILAVGLYGKQLLPQNGAPLRLVVPWKYGFKSIKSIVRLRLTAKQPVSSWQASGPQEYGFY